MTIITITPQPENGALSLAVTANATITAITRSDANGVAEVRTLPGVLPYTPTLVERRRNEVTNPSFENGTTGWLPTRCTLYQYNWSTSSNWTNYTPGPSGGYGMRVTSDAATGAAVAASNYSPVVAGEWVAASLNASAASVRWAVGVSFYNGASYISEVYGAQMSGSVYNLAGSVVSAQAPATATQYKVLYRLYGPGGESIPPAASTGYLDRAIAAHRPTQAAALADVETYFDGSTATDTAAVSSWAGPAHGSVSIESVPAADLILTDYEAASGTVIYTAGTATASTTWDIGAPWLFVPVMPNYSARLQSVLDYSASGDSLGTIHELLGRTDPVAVLRGMGTRAGNLSLWCGTFPAAVAVLEALKRGQVLMLRQPEHQGMDMYFTATGYNIKPLTVDGADTVWAVDVGYRQIARPLAPLAGSLGWTFAALASRYPTFAALPGAYATFQTLQLDEVKP